jgi:predicted dehydrogenase
MAFSSDFDCNSTDKAINRRTFLKSTAAASAALLASPMIKEAFSDTGKKPDQINVALLGAGAQGQVLSDACMKIKGLRFKAVCDIWADFNLKTVSRRLKAYKHEANPYTDYKEMLDKEKDLDAVIIATPDFWHAEHTAACLKAGLHVYCEKEMSNTLEGAKQMVLAARETGKLLQIGHQRRSNPRYLHCYDKLITEANLLGKITTIYGQWNRSKAACEDLGWPERSPVDEATLNKFGFNSMKQFRNWRWYKGLGGGPIVDLGSHQIDIYSWFLGCEPKSVMASGGIDYWKGRQWFDNVIAVYEYDTPAGIVRATYQTITTNSNGGYYETFMGDEGTLSISESSGRGEIFREAWVPTDKWDVWVKRGYLLAPVEKPAAQASTALLDVRETKAPPSYALPVTFNDPYHMPHLQNFFDSIRGKAKLNCPAEEAYKSAVAVLKVNQAIESGTKLEFKPEEFKV